MNMRVLWIIVCLSTAVGCASAPRKLTPAEVVAQARAVADASLKEGCYDCLLNARATYEKVAAGRVRTALVVPMFEVELLITLREKELAMDSSASFARAQALASELPPAVDAARYLALVAGVPPDSLGVPRTEDVAFRRDRSAFIARINAEMDWLTTGPLQPVVRQYLSISIDCKYLVRARGNGRTTASASVVPPDAPPLIAYRAATCDDINRATLDRVRTDVPGFVDAAIFQARQEVANVQRTGGSGARPLLAAAYARFPTSPSVTYLNGNFQQAIGDCAEGLRFYDETLALKPLHETALLGRTVCLTFLNRPEEAIATATRMIELKTFNVHEAYFWRAWILHERQDLKPAREDIERAKAIASTNEILRLAGIIEYDQDDLAVSEKDLIAAKALAGGDCIARWYLGLVAMKRSLWNDSAAQFEDSMNCYERGALLSEAALASMEAKTDIDPVFKARQVEGFKAAVKDDRSQQYAAAFNAANHFARGGKIDKARVLIEIAAKDPGLEKVVAELRKAIGGE